MEELPDPGMDQFGIKKKKQVLFLRTSNGDKRHLGVWGLFRNQCLSALLIRLTRCASRVCL